jgi:NAD(P)H-dependent FMN reductase
LWNRPLEEWTNPVLVVRPNGVELVSRRGSVGSGVLSVEQLKVLLQSLPADAWPLGRVVALAETSIGSAGDEPKIEANSAALAKMLRTLDVELSWWPSA